MQRTEALVANRIVHDIEAVTGYRAARTPVGVYGSLSLGYFDGKRRSFGGGLSPRITKTAYSALSEVAGYELKQPPAAQSRRMAATCPAKSAAAPDGVWYSIDAFENGVVVCFFPPTRFRKVRASGAPPDAKTDDAMGDGS